MNGSMKICIVHQKSGYLACEDKKSLIAKPPLLLLTPELEWLFQNISRPNNLSCGDKFLPKSAEY
jgi:hypothetical protein